jgi:glycerate 2-kinase
VNILVAPCAYKGSIQASTLAQAIDRGLGLAGQVELLPMADGGDDTLCCLKLSIGGDFVYAMVQDALGRRHQAAYLQAGRRAYVELAQASGIAGLERLDPLNAQTYGTGELISLAMEQGAEEIVIFLGGSASTDGGAGALAALGGQIRDGQGNDIVGGGNLGSVAKIDLQPVLSRASQIRFIVATDVVNPLLGPNGAAAVFGPQKGADPAQVELLDRALAHFADCLEAAVSTGITASCNRRNEPGAGAAGGTGFGLGVGLGAEIVSGFEYLAEVSRLGDKLAWADAVVVAEGALDEQSLSGKATGEILKLARARGKKVWALPACCKLSEQSRGLFDRIIETAQGSQAQVADVELAAGLLRAAYLV